MVNIRPTCKNQSLSKRSADMVFSCIGTILQLTPVKLQWQLYGNVDTSFQCIHQIWPAGLKFEKKHWRDQIFNIEQEQVLAAVDGCLTEPDLTFCKTGQLNWRRDRTSVMTCWLLDCVENNKSQRQFFIDSYMPIGDILCWPFACIDCEGVVW